WIEEAGGVLAEEVAVVEVRHRAAAAAGVLVAAPTAAALEIPAIEHLREELALVHQAIERLVAHVARGKSVEQHGTEGDLALGVDRDPRPDPASDRRVLRHRSVARSPGDLRMQLRREEERRVAHVPVHVPAESGMEAVLEVPAIEAQLAEALGARAARDQRRAVVRDPPADEVVDRPLEALRVVLADRDD